MKRKLIILMFCLSLWRKDVIALSFPGPRVYVVTASPRPVQIDDGKSAPFYYHNWMRRMDADANVTLTSTSAPPKEKTPDLIFAEFESDGSNQKSIRKLIEKERVTLKPILKPIYVPDEETTKAPQGLYQELSKPDILSKDRFTKPSSYMFDEFYSNAPAPVYIPSTVPTTTTSKPTTQETKTTTTTGPINIENIWHIIDNEKFNQQSGHWDEFSSEPSDEHKITDTKSTYSDQNTESPNENDNGTTEDNEDDVKIDENFALPGIGTNPGNGAENESRAIRVEPNLRFPYVNLKPFQMKKPMVNVLANSKKGNMFNSLDNFYDLKQPVRGEAQDVVPMSQPIDRYNPAQPYLPKPDYGSKMSVPSSQVIYPPKATANLVPPPPPKITGDDFPSPSSYESFPPYAPASFNFAPGPAFKQASRPLPTPVPPPVPPPASAQVSAMSVPSVETSIDTYSSDVGDDVSSPVMDLGYGYKPPSAPIAHFVPTLPPPAISAQGYSYNKPSLSNNLAPPLIKPDFQGYEYKKPEPPPSMDQMPSFEGYQYPKPEMSPPMDHDFKGYHYKKPDVMPFFDHKPSYEAPADHGDHGSPPENHDSDYPELIFNKHHDDDKVGGDMKGSDMGMMPPPPPADAKPDMSDPPMDDHGFPSDFPDDFKYHHDFDDHDHDHDHYHHHHHTTTTTTTTEMPRVNRFSYYYLGKKLYYLPLYFSVYFIIYVGALIIKAVLRHKIVYPNSWRPNTTTASFFSKRSVDSYLSNENLHELTGKVTHAIATAAQKYIESKSK